MRFCPNCQRTMTRDTSSGTVTFQCVCGVSEPGRAEDARIGGAVLGAGETTEMYHRLIQTAPFDRTNQLVRRSCADCGRDYMTQIRVGESEVIVYKCKCGKMEGSSDRAEGSSGRAEPPAAGTP